MWKVEGICAEDVERDIGALQLATVRAVVGGPDMGVSRARRGGAHCAGLRAAHISQAVI